MNGGRAIEQESAADVAPPQTDTSVTALKACRAEVDKTKAAADSLKEQLNMLDARREKHMKAKPSVRAADPRTRPVRRAMCPHHHPHHGPRRHPAAQGNKRSMQEVEELMRLKDLELSHSSLSIREEKEKLKEMKKMKDDAKRMVEWELELDGLRNKRSALLEQLRQARRGGGGGGGRSTAE